MLEHTLNYIEIGEAILSKSDDCWLWPARRIGNMLLGVTTTCYMRQSSCVSVGRGDDEPSSSAPEAWAQGHTASGKRERRECAPARTNKSKRTVLLQWISSRDTRTHPRSKHAVGLQNAVQTKKKRKQKTCKSSTTGPHPMLIFQARQWRRRRRLGCAHFRQRPLSAHYYYPRLTPSRRKTKEPEPRARERNL